jgi:hypothetical protein
MPILMGPYFFMLAQAIFFSGTAIDSTCFLRLMSCKMLLRLFFFSLSAASSIRVLADLVSSGAC